MPRPLLSVDSRSAWAVAPVCLLLAICILLGSWLLFTSGLEPDDPRTGDLLSSIVQVQTELVAAQGRQIETQAETLQLLHGHSEAQAETLQLLHGHSEALQLLHGQVAVLESAMKKVTADIGFKRKAEASDAKPRIQAPAPRPQPTLSDSPRAIEATSLQAATPEATSHQATALTNINYSETSDGVLIHLEADGSVDAIEIFRLEDPDRLVVDLTGIRNQVDQAITSVGTPQVAQVRVGAHGNKVRVVIDGGEGAEGFEERRITPTDDGLYLALGSGPDLDAVLAAAMGAESVQIVAVQKPVEAISRQAAATEATSRQAAAREAASQQAAATEAASQQAAATEAASQQAAATQTASPQAAANGEASQQAAATESSSQQSRPDAREKDADERNAQLAEAIPVQTGGVLLPRGRLTLEPQFRYSYASVNRVQIAGYTILPALTLGLIDVTRHDRSTITSMLTARYGLTDRIELDLSVPYVAAWSRFRLSPKNTDGNLDKNQTADGHGIGDVQFGLRTQLNQGTSSIASFVAGVGVRIPTGKSPYEVKREGLFDQFIEQEVPTGSGFYSLNPTLSFVYPTEPGVLFGNLHYSWNIPRTISATQPNTDQPYGKIDPGDVLGASLGMGLSLNEKLSLSFSYDHSMVFQTRQNGLISEDSVPLQIGTLGLGATKRRNSKISYSFMIGVGVTDDAPDVSLTFRVPTTWDLLK